MSGGKSNKRGTPQGSVISPLLSVIHMNRFLKLWRLSGRREAFRAHVISYADDFVILSRGHAEEALTWTRAVMTNARVDTQRGENLGEERPIGGTVVSWRGSVQESVLRIKRKVSELLTPGNKGVWPEYKHD
ncbi:reverse transcriptase (RNA-dependent DNA polymerase) [Bradyrhizobium macuxiense]|uniref:Reverse transcriptase (RNA-dependent DNA polymerase) n=1 Tax=Bradyrhizobium macuxiense TaxID=1755647 RepID=A0A560KS44_9BRAD|nr:reverse transcriptase domain-containing protein [Bradyrhizobium macuxiense]TWB86007.1 reverse transcriptase (RNA-dependent DNA polymerase) [Bradyrhizobium macuxiense]